MFSDSDKDTAWLMKPLVTVNKHFLKQFNQEVINKKMEHLPTYVCVITTMIFFKQTIACGQGTSGW